VIWRFLLSGFIWTLAIYQWWGGESLDATVVAMWGVINIWHAIESNRRKEMKQ
jgi:hypothetical protein